MIGTMLGVLFVCLIGTVPIAVSLGLSCVATFALGGGGNMIQMLAQSMVTSMDSFSLMAIPFFMLVGSLMEYGGIAKKLVDVAEMMTGNMPGGLGMAAIVASMFFAAISGSGPATAAAIGGIMIGAMVSQGYSKGYSGALIGGRQYHWSGYPAVHSHDHVWCHYWRFCILYVHCRHHSWYFNGCCIDDL